MGRVERRGEVWTTRVSLTDPATGQRVQRRVTARTKRELTQAVADARAAFKLAGGHEDVPDVTVAQLAEAWLAEYRPRSTSTYYNRAQVVEKHIVGSDLGAVRLPLLRASHVQAWVDELAGRYAANTVQVCVGALSLALQRGRRGRLMDDVVVPPAGHAAWTVWDREQVGRFLAVSAGDERAGLWALLVLVGLRVGEALALRWEDLSELGTLRVGASLRRERDGSWGVSAGTKGGRERVVHLPRLCLDRIGAQPRLSEEWIFPQPPGWRLGHVHWVRAELLRLAAVAELPPCRVHDLRHMAATHALRAGLPITVVAHMLGHATPAITLRVYAHVVAEMEEAAAARIDQLYGGQTANSDQIVPEVRQVR